MSALCGCRPKRDGGANRQVYANNAARMGEAGFPNNAISNTKYNVVSFVPKNLMEQFSRNMNRYFLVIACLQLVRDITPVNPLTTWLPLAVIFAVTAVKEAVDDIGRARSDAAANARIYTVIRQGRRDLVPSKDIVCGDIVMLRENDEVPCDLVLLSSSDANGNAFIQTTNLDGESNLKVRTALPATKGMTNERELGAFTGVIECAAPNEHLYRFDSQLRMTPTSGTVLPLSATQLLLQATHVRNTDFVFGMAVYTGNESKYGNNKKAPPTKYTETDAFIDRISGGIFAFQLLLVLIFGIVGDTWEVNIGRAAEYLYFTPPYPGYTPLIIPARFLLLNSTMIPISLKLTLDLCKLAYAQYINSDIQLYDAVNDIPAHSNSTALSEDLGQVRYILTDKTGTLTENRMVLKVATVRGQQYGTPDEAVGDNLNPVPRTPGHDSLPLTPPDPRTPGGAAMPHPLARAASAGILADTRLFETIVAEAHAGTVAPSAIEFMRCLAINNDVVPSLGADGARHYKASSPDEEALVKAAAGYGVTLWAREGEVATLDVHGTRESYTQLACFEFTSDRKRMSVIVRNNATGALRLYCKGADDMLMSRLAPGQSCAAIVQAQVDAYATLGLRTLVMSMRDLSPAEYAAFESNFAAAAAAMTDRDTAKERVYTMMETQLQLIGATAIEDKLQDGVPATIATLKSAGVSFWMLTGDKFSTALTIAKTCNLKPSGNVLVEIDADESRLDDVRSALEAAWRRITDELGYSLFYEEMPTGMDAYKRWCSNLGSCMQGGGMAAFARPNSVAYNPLPDPSSSPMRGPATSSALAPRVPNVYGSVGAARTPVSSSPRVAYTLIIRGPVIQVALDNWKHRFAAMCVSADSVICCRVTPKQKGLLVRLVKDAGHKTLAIGDGGNDVAMIQEAHVGVGIQGKEGLQAARAADYKVAFFRALSRLLLIHGRYSYYRTALVVQYSFYKSFLFCVMQIGFGFFSGYAGVSLFNSLCVAAYNAVLFVPIVFFMVDKDITQATALAIPSAYRVCAAGQLLTTSGMLWWFARGLWQAVVILLFSLYGSGSSRSGDYESMGLLAFFAYMWVQDVTMLMALRRVTLINSITIFGMHALAFLIALAVNTSTTFLSFIDTNSLTNAAGDPTFWLQHLLITVACVAPVEAYRAYTTNYTTSFDTALLRVDAQIERDLGPTAAAAPTQNDVLRVSGGSAFRSGGNSDDAVANPLRALGGAGGGPAGGTRSGSDGSDTPLTQSRAADVARRSYAQARAELTNDDDGGRDDAVSYSKAVGVAHTFTPTVTHAHTFTGASGGRTSPRGGASTTTYDDFGAAPKRGSSTVSASPHSLAAKAAERMAGGPVKLLSGVPPRVKVPVTM